MKSLYESILDDEEVLMGNVEIDVIARPIYKKLINRETLNQSELNWMNNNVSVLEVNIHQLRNLLSKLHKQYYNISLNWLDVSKITNMSELFRNSKFNGDISKWDVSSVRNMQNMFSYSKFTGDISGWDASRVKDMYSMFEASKFNGNISKCNVRDKRQLMFRFYNPIFHDSVKADVIKKDFYNSYKITYDDFKNKFKPNLIKELDLKQTDQLFDEWIMEL